MPVGAERVGESGQGEVEKAEEAGQRRQQEDGQHFPVVECCPLPRLV